MSTEIGSRRVVIVEDEGAVAMLLEDMLTDLGHEVIAIVGQLKRAERLMSEVAADIVILDVNLNGEQTYPLADILASRDIPFIFATGYGSAGLNGAWRDRPVLQKPFHAGDLDRAIRQVFATT